MKLRNIIAFVFVSLSYLWSAIEKHNEFSTNFSGSPSDTINAYSGWPDTLSILVKRTDFISVVDKALNDGVVDNKLGSYPVVNMPAIGKVDVVYNSWAFDHVGVNVSAAHQVRLRNYRVDVTPIVSSERIIAEDENPVDANYYGGVNQQYSPNSISLSSDDAGLFSSVWGSVTFGPVRMTNSARYNGFVNAFQRGINFDTNVVETQLGGNPSMSMIPRHSFSSQVVVYGLASKDGLNNFRAVIHKENFPNRASVLRDTFPAFSGPNIIMRSFQIKTDSSGTAAVLWIENNNIYGRVYDQNLNLISATTALTNTSDVEVRNVLSEVNSPFVGMTNTIKNRFIITYGRNGRIYYKIWNTQNNTLSTEQLLISSTSNHWPSVDAEANKLAFGYYGNLTGGTNRAHLCLFDMDASGNPILSTRLDTALVNFNTTFTHSFGTRVHNFNNVNISVDSIGGVAAAFNHETSAWLSVWTYKPYYADSSFYRSATLEFKVPGINNAWSSEDSIYVHSIKYSSDSLVEFKMNQSSSNSMIPLLQSFVAPHYQDSVAPAAVSGKWYNYEIKLKASQLFRVAPVVDSVEISWNAKPRQPRLDSLRLGANWSVKQDTILLMSLRDSLALKYVHFDYSGEGNLTIYTSFMNVLDSQIILTDSAGFYNSYHQISIKDTIGLFPFLIWSKDVYGAKSKIDTLWINYRNDPPLASLNWVKENGLAQIDTSAFNESLIKVYNASSQMKIYGLASDSNVSTMNLRWTTKLSKLSGLLNLTSGTPFLFDFPSRVDDSLDLISNWFLDVDTLEISLDDGIDTLVYKQPFVINHKPRNDSLSTIAYGSPRVDTTLYTANKFPGRVGAVIVPYVPSYLKMYASDSEKKHGDSIEIEWYLIDLNNDGTCCVNRRGPIFSGQEIDLGDDRLLNDSLYLGNQSWIGPAQIKSFYDYPPLLITKVIDGQFFSHEDTLMLQYSILDTTKNPYFGSAIDYLAMNLEYVAGGAKLKDTVEAVIHSVGTIPLGIYSVKTKRNQGLWLDIDWIGSDSIRYDAKTDSSKILANKPQQINKGDSVKIRFLVDVNPMRGDYEIYDTLYVETNDFLNSTLALPFVLKVSDMPLVNVSFQELATPSKEIFDFESGSIPIRSQIRLSFSEPVLKTSVKKSIEIYSLLDSLVRLPAIHEEYNALYAEKFLMNTAKDKNGKLLNLYSDTVYFRPKYDQASDSLLLLAPPGLWIPRDVVRLKITNNIIDTLGNPLDLDRSRILYAVGSKDSIFTAYIDSSVFKVDTSKFIPKLGGTFNSDDELVISFNAPLVEFNVFENDTVYSIDTTNLSEGLQLPVRIKSAKLGGAFVPIRGIETRNGDSSLVIKPLRRFYAGDTLSVKIMSSTSDIWGRTLDGNLDGKYDYLFNFKDSLDFYEYQFVVSEGKYYSYPNPFRAYLKEHRDIGGISFKNLSLIKGLDNDEKWEVAFYDLTGQKIFRKEIYNPISDLNNPPVEWLWDLKNSNGRNVASGSYMYIFYSNGEAVKKGKVALIR